MKRTAGPDIKLYRRTVKCAKAIERQDSQEPVPTEDTEENRIDTAPGCQYFARSREIDRGQIEPLPFGGYI